MAEIFGAQVRLAADKSTEARDAFAKDIQDLANRIGLRNAPQLRYVRVNKETASAQLIKDINDIINNIPRNQAPTLGIVRVESIDATEAIAKFRGQLEQMLSALVINGNSVQGLGAILGDTGRQNVFDGVARSAENAEERIRRAAEAARGFNAEQELSNLETSIGREFQKATIGNARIVDTTAVDDITQKYNELSVAIQNARAQGGAVTPEEIQQITQSEEALRRLITTQRERQNLQRQELRTEAQVASARRSIINLDAQLANILRSNTRAAGNESVSFRIQQLRSDLANIDPAAEGASASIADMRAQIAELNREIRGDSRLRGNTVIDQATSAFQKFGGWLTVTRTVSAAIRSIRNMITDVIAMDTAMTDLRIITNETEEAYASFGRTAVDVARQVGSSVTDLLNSSTTWARLGYNLQDALDLSAITTVFSNVAGLDIDSATTSLVSSLNAFGFAAEDALSLVDRFTSVGNAFAIDAAGIGEALQASAASLMAAGNSVDQSIALVTAGNLILQNPGSVGNALKTTSLRIRGATADLAAMGEEVDDLVTSSSSLREELLALTGVDIMLDEDTFKSTYDILAEIAGQWDRITDVSRAAVTEALAGKRNSNVVLSIIQNFSQAESALATSLNSSGAALEANEIRINSIQGRMDIFTATFQGLAQTLINTDLFGGIVDTGSNLLSLLDSMIQRFGSLNTIVLASSATLGLMGRRNGIFTEDSPIIQGINSSLFEDSGNISTKAFNDLTQGLETYQTAINSGIESTNAFAVAFGSTSRAVKNGANEIINGTKSINDFTVSTGRAAAGARILAAGMNIIANVGISIAINLVINAISSLITQQERLREAAQEASRSISDQRSSMEQNISEIQRLRDSLDNQNISYEDAISARERLTEIQTSLIETYGREAYGIDLVNGSLSENIRLIEEANRSAAYNQIAENADAYADAIERLNNANRVSGEVLESLNPTTFLGQPIALTEEYGNVLDEFSDKTDRFMTLFRRLEETGALEGIDIVQNRGGDGLPNGGVTLQINADTYTAREQLTLLRETLESLRLEAPELTEEINALQESFVAPALSQFEQLYSQYQGIVNEYSRNLIERNEATQALFYETSDAIAAYQQSIIRNVDPGDSLQQSIDMFNSLTAAINDAGYSDAERNSTLAFVREFFGQGIIPGLQREYTVLTDDIISRLEDIGISIRDISNIPFSDNNALTEFIAGLDISDEQASRLTSLVEQIGAVVESLNLLGATPQRTSLGGAVFESEDMGKSADEIISALNRVTKAEQAYNRVADSNTARLSNEILVGLLETYPELSGLIEQYNDRLIGTDEILAALEERYNDAAVAAGFYGDITADATRSIGEITSAIRTETSALDAAKSDIDEYGTITIATLGTIANTYGDLREQISAFLSGAITESDFMGTLNARYEESMSNYGRMIAQMNDESTSFFAKILDDSADIVSDIAQNYNIDLNNFRTLAQAKIQAHNSVIEGIVSGWSDEYIVKMAQLYGIDLENYRNGVISKAQLEQQLISTLSSAWAQYYDAQGNLNESALGDYAYGTELVVGPNGSIYYNEQQLAAQEYLNNIRNYQRDLERLSSDIDISSIFNTTGVGSGGRGSGTSRETELYVMDLDRLYEITKRILDIQNEQALVQEQMKQLRDDEYVSETQQLNRLISLDAQNNALLEERNRLRRQWIQENVNELREWGFNISYVAEENDLLIHNMERVNEIWSGTTEQTNEVRRALESLINETEGLNSDAVEDTLSISQNLNSIKENMESIEAVYRRMYSDNQGNRENANTLLQNQYNEQQGNQDFNAMRENLDRQRTYFIASQNAAFQEAQRIRAQGLENLTVDQANYLAELSQQWWDWEREIQAVNDRYVEIILSPYDQLIDRADTFDLWNNMDLSRLDVLQNKLKELNNLFERGYLTIEQYNQARLELGTDIYDTQRDALESILDMTMELIRWEVEEQIRALQAQIDAYQKIVQLKKDSLAATREEESYQRNVRDRVKAISDLQERINILSRDDSREAIAERKRLEEELAGLQTDLADTQADYAYDATIDRLDKEYEDYRARKEEEIRILEESINTEVKLYNLAINRIDKDWQALYNDLALYASQYGDAIDGVDSVRSAWENATDAIREYKTFADALSNIRYETPGNIESNNAGSSGNVSGNTGTGSGSSGSTALNQQLARDIVNQMKRNASKWAGASDAEKARLDQTNQNLSRELNNYLPTGTSVRRGADGVWYLSDGRRLFDVYHSGGVVGGTSAGFTKQNELLALLQKGEVVLDEPKINSAYRFIDIAKTLIDGIGNSFGSALPFSLRGQTSPDMVRPSGGSSASPLNVEVNIADIGDMTRSQATDLGRTVGNEASAALMEALGQRGVRKNAPLSLRP